MSFQDFLRDNDYNVRSYSGRGMYGKTCLGINIDCDLTKFVSQVLLNIIEDPNSQRLTEEFALCMRCAQTDNMGMGSIIYFPNIDYDRGDDEPDSSEDE